MPIRNGVSNRLVCRTGKHQVWCSSSVGTCIAWRSTVGIFDFEVKSGRVGRVVDLGHEDLTTSCTVTLALAVEADTAKSMTILPPRAVIDDVVDEAINHLSCRQELVQQCRHLVQLYPLGFGIAWLQC